MVLRRSIIFTFTVALVMPLSPRVASACGCEPLGSVTDQLSKAHVVFSGRIIRLELAKTVGRPTEDMVATFTVERRWKGAANRTIQVRTSGNQAAVSTCGVHFQLGRRYVIFATDKPLMTTNCWFNRAVEDAAEVIRELDGAAKN